MGVELTHINACAQRGKAANTGLRTLKRSPVNTTDIMDNQDEQLLPCHEKIAFATQDQARAAAAIDAYRHGSTLKAYHCRHCGFWHLSSH